MAGLQKEHTAQKSVQLVKKSLGVTPRQATVLVEKIRSASKDDLSAIESLVMQPLTRLSIKKPEIVELVRILKYKVPRSALRWLSFMTDEQRAKIRIATNSTLDRLYTGNEWTLISSGGLVLSSTILVYPKSGQRMPGLVETYYNGRRCLVHTQKYQGESNIALAFDDYDIKVYKDRGGGEVITYIPAGKITVIRRFPSVRDWFVMRDGHEILGTVGQGRYLHRTKDAWVGPIFRSHETVKEFNTDINDERTRVTLYACPTRKDMFGLVLEAPVISRDAADRPEKQVPLFDRPAPIQQPEPKRVFDSKEVLDLMEVLGNRTLFYIQNPEMLKVAFHPAEEVSARYALIGQIDRKSQGTIREIARSTIFLTYLNASPEFTAERFALTFWKLCDALGVQNELSSGWKRI